MLCEGTAAAVVDRTRGGRVTTIIVFDVVTFISELLLIMLLLFLGFRGGSISVYFDVLDRKDSIGVWYDCLSVMLVCSIVATSLLFDRRCDKLLVQIVNCFLQEFVVAALIIV